MGSLKQQCLQELQNPDEPLGAGSMVFTPPSLLRFHTKRYLHLWWSWWKCQLEDSPEGPDSSNLKEEPIIR